MLELRYDEVTRVVTGWCGDPTQFGNLKRRNKDEKTKVLDVPIPPKKCLAYLFDGTSLIDNPNYIEPKEDRNLEAELDELKQKLIEAGVI